VLRDGQGLTLRASLSNRRDILECQRGVTIGVVEEQALHGAPLDLTWCATNAVAYALGNSRRGRRTAWTTTRFVLVLLPATQSLPRQRKDAVSDFLQRRLHEALLSLELCADGRGEWSLMMPVSSDLPEATVIAVSSWDEESMMVDIPAKTMGCVMRLSSALGH